MSINLGLVVGITIKFEGFNPPTCWSPSPCSNIKHLRLWIRAEENYE